MVSIKVVSRFYIQYRYNLELSDGIAPDYERLSSRSSEELTLEVYNILVY